MSDTNQDISDVKKAAEQVDGQKIKENLKDDTVEDTKKIGRPEELSEEEQTSFINDDLRTDK